MSRPQAKAPLPAGSVPPSRRSGYAARKEQFLTSPGASRHPPHKGGLWPPAANPHSSRKNSTGRAARQRVLCLFRDP